MDVSTLHERRKLANYCFTGTVDVASTGPTYIPFVSVKAPFAVVDKTPTILRHFGAGRILSDMQGFASNQEMYGGSLPAGTGSPYGVHNALPRAPSIMSRQPTPALQPTSRQPTPALQVAPRQVTPAIQYVSRQPTPRQSTPSLNDASRQTTPELPASHSRAPTPIPHHSSRGTPAPSIPSSRAVSVPPTQPHRNARSVHGAVQSVSTRSSARGRSNPPDNFEDYLPPPRASASASSSAQPPNVTTRSRAASLAASIETDPIDPSPLAFIRHFKYCQLTSEEKPLVANRKGKSASTRTYTAWFETAFEKPRASPPDLTARADLTVGDVFWHRSSQGIQLWLWLDDPDKGLCWTPVTLGYYREEDGRRLFLTPTEKPTWVQENWYRKKLKEITVSVFILQT